ncbi:hypothetical protein Taro_023121 [Colocasia esculenta]|uniref:Uncharacterized protein n=1 Tax=Colocasia esculenta TaxID=4460 RepID=A0A843V335_COLES|nr:hypothetical protein [Colocasia esculenta]
MTTMTATAPGLRLRPSSSPHTLIPKPFPARRLPPLSRRLYLPLGNPSPDLPSASLRFRSLTTASSSSPSSSRRGWPPRRGGARCSAVGGGGGPAQGEADYEHTRMLYPRPQAIPWQKDLANTVHLIGIVGGPVQIKHASSGKVLAWTRLGVKTSATDTAWINLTLWDELAHVAFQHLEKGQQIYVCGRLVADTVEGDGNKRQVYYKVVVQQLNFIERSLPPVSLYGSDSGFSTNASGNSGNYAGKQGSSAEELWQAFFANPVDWWDNRKNKRNPRAPDFKHKHTGEALWIEGRYNPPWVKSQLAILDSRMSSLQSNDTNPALWRAHAFLKESPPTCPALVRGGFGAKMFDLKRST